MRIAIKLAAFLAGAYVSSLVLVEHWYVGPVFGLVVLVWHWEPRRRIAWGRCALFLACATLIYALVVHLTFRPFFAPIVGREALDTEAYRHGVVFLGTLLLALAHGAALGAPRRRVAVAAVGVFAAYFLTGTTLSYLRVSSNLLGVGAWQGLYLLFMFGRWPARGRRPETT